MRCVALVESKRHISGLLMQGFTPHSLERPSKWSSCSSRTTVPRSQYFSIALMLTIVVSSSPYQTRHPVSVPVSIGGG